MAEFTEFAGQQIIMYLTSSLNTSWGKEMDNSYRETLVRFLITWNLNSANGYFEFSSFSEDFHSSHEN